MAAGHREAAHSVLDDGEHNVNLDRSGIERFKRWVLMQTDMRSYSTAATCRGTSAAHCLCRMGGAEHGRVPDLTSACAAGSAVEGSYDRSLRKNS
jgi:hypothetical protein